MKAIIRLLILTFCCTTASGFGQNAPVTVAGTVVSLETTATMPVYAMNFNNISSCNLKLNYDPAIASATEVMIGSGMGGMISTNLTIPGVIILGWFTSSGISMPDSSIIFEISFSKNNNGISAINWLDDGNSCKYNSGNFITLNDSPTEDYYINGMLVFQPSNAPITILPSIAGTPGTSVYVPVTVNDFQLIGSFSLHLQYETSVLIYNSFVNDSEFPGLLIEVNQPGNIQITGLVPLNDTAVSLDNNATLFTLIFDYQGGFSELNWIDNGTSCLYTGSQPVYPVLSDIPQNSYYLNGAISANTLPLAAGPISGPAEVCIGTSIVYYSVDVIAYANSYNWSVPIGATIISGQNSNSIQVDFGVNPFSGFISVCGINEFGNGDTSFLEVASIDIPAPAGLVQGETEVCQGQDNVLYSIEPVSNATHYNWILPQGAVITSGANTNSITIRFENSALNGIISVSGVNVCGLGMPSLPLQIKVNSIPAIQNQPVTPSSVIAGNGTSVFSVQASGTNLTYQWQEFIISWSDLTESNMYKGVIEDTLQIINPLINMNGFRYRCLISGLCEPSLFTDGNAILNVVPAVGIESNGSLDLVSAGPNPFSDFIYLKLNSSIGGELNILLVDLQGKIAKSYSEISLSPEECAITLTTSGLKAGFYLLHLNFKTENNLMTSTKYMVCCH